MNTKHDFRLEGLSAGNLGEYLAATGILRLVSEQVDPQATLRWDRNTPVLSTFLDRERLFQFLLDDAQFAPLVAPWNGKDLGGFLPGDKGRSARLVGQFRESTSPRLAVYRATIMAVDEAVAIYGWDGKLEKADKSFAVKALRNTLPDEALDFLDAAVVYSNGTLKFPPLLGTGANIGALLLVPPYMEHVTRIVGLDTPKRKTAPTSTEWLTETFDDTPARRLATSSGQYDIQGAGGDNMGRTGEAKALTNPWHFVLSLHGALTFASGMSRRQGADTGMMSAPFTVGATHEGYPSSADGEAEKAKGEFWAPVWDTPIGYPELASFAGEGRISWKGRQAKDGLDAVRAMKALGTDRGIGRFERFAFLERAGQSQVAVHVGEHRTGDRPQVALTGELDWWIGKLRRGTNPPASVTGAIRQFDRTLFAAANSPTSDTLRVFLGAVTAAERTVFRSTQFRDNTQIGPVQPLGTLEWFPHLDDGTPEFRVAAALTLGGDHHRTSETVDRAPRSLREMVRPVETQGRTRLGWASRKLPVGGYGSRPFHQVLADVLTVRCRTRTNPIVPGGDVPPFRGVRPQFWVTSEWAAPVADVEAFAAGDYDERLLAEWVDALLLFAPRSHTGLPQPAAADRSPALCAAWKVCAPWVSEHPVGAGTGRVTVPVIPKRWGAQLCAGNLERVIEDALGRYKIAGVTPIWATAHAPLIAGHTDPKRVAAALMVPTRRDETSRLFTLNTIQ